MEVLNPDGSWEQVDNTVRDESLEKLWEAREVLHAMGKMDNSITVPKGGLSTYKGLVDTVIGGLENTDENEVENSVVELSSLIQARPASEESGQLVEYMVNRLVDSRATLEKLLNGADQPCRSEALQIMTRLLEKGNVSENGIKMLEVMKRNSEKIFEMMSGDDGFDQLYAHRAFKKMNDLLPYDQAEANEERIIEALKVGKHPWVIGMVTADYMDRSSWSHQNQFGKKIMREVLAYRIKDADDNPIDPQIWVSAWEQSTEAEKMPKAFRDNFELMIKLETERPGIVSVLKRDFGIFDLSRYPKAFLIEQYDQRDNTDLPYMLVILPRDDYNGAFYQHEHILKSLQKQFDGKCLIRAVEVGSKMEAGRQLLKLDHRYGDKQKILGAIIGGHGGKDGISFGRGKGIFRLTLEDLGLALKPKDLVGHGLNRVGGFFVEHPMIVLSSCKTGQWGGVAEKMSKLGATVTAPRKATGMAEIHVMLDQVGDRFRLWLGPVYAKGRAVTFVNGEKVGER